MHFLLLDDEILLSKWVWDCFYIKTTVFVEVIQDPILGKCFFRSTLYNTSYYQDSIQMKWFQYQTKAAIFCFIIYDIATIKLNLVNDLKIVIKGGLAKEMMIWYLVFENEVTFKSRVNLKWMSLKLISISPLTSAHFLIRFSCHVVAIFPSNYQYIHSS